jgi:hypothetical protein
MVCSIHIIEICVSEMTKIKITQHNKTRNEQPAHFCRENLMDTAT